MSGRFEFFNVYVWKKGLYLCLIKRDRTSPIFDFHLNNWHGYHLPVDTDSNPFFKIVTNASSG